MKQIFTAILPNVEACERFRNMHTDLAKDYHVIIVGTSSIDTPQFKLHSANEMNQNRINAEKYGRL